MRNNIKYTLILLIISFLMLPLCNKVFAQVLSDFEQMPPFASSTVVAPNILLDIDVSGSMSWDAYLSNYDPNTTYEGYFIPNRLYVRDSNNIWTETSGPGNCSLPWWWGLTGTCSGNFLNWYYMTRIDLVRWAITGGMPASCTGSHTFDANYCDPELWSETGNSTKVGSVCNNSLDVNADGNPDGGCILSTLWGEEVKVPWSRIKSSLSFQFKTFSLKPRMGAMFFSSSGIRSGKVYIGDFTSPNSTNSQYPYMNLITYVNSTEPSGSTPTGPAMWDTLNYFAQTQPQYGGFTPQSGTGDLWRNPLYICDQGGTNCSFTPCSKNYVILLSDGQWNTPSCDIADGFQNNSSDPVVPAYKMHMGFVNQPTGETINIDSVYTIGLFLGGTGELSLKNVAMYGSFDNTSKTWPDSISGYPWNTCTMDDCWWWGRGSGCTPLPQSSEDWDKDSNSVPDTFQNAQNATEIKDTIMNAVLEILKRSSSGTAVSVLSTSGSGEGAVYQAYFYPEKTEGTESRKWLGYLHALFVDKYGNLREDTNEDDTLELDTDYIIKMRFDSQQGTLVDKYADTDGDGVADSSTPDSTVTIDDVKTIWDAGKQLWQTAPSNRTIFTTTDGYTKLDFTTTNSSTLLPYLRAADSTEATNMINWIRGTDVTGTDAGHPNGYRKRDLTIDGTNNVWKLGDIVYSTPTVVSRPNENYDLLYGDTSYTDFRYKYLHRRQVVYVGANDGMLHAFNAGYYDEDNHKFCTALDSNYHCTTGGKALGTELWAFIPRAVLPHLKWLTGPDYTHVPYVDLKPKVADVKIFTDDTTHPGGWGTILIGGLRYGGKDITWTSGSTTYSTSSEYFAIDITDPDNPRLLWTFTNPELGLTMSYPAIARTCSSGTGSTCKWFVVFGNGPTDYDINSNPSAFQTNHIFVLDISSGTNGVITTWSSGSNYWKLLTDSPSGKTGYLSSPITVDVDFDYDTDVIYLGENYQQGTSWRTRMLRITTTKGTSTDPSNWTVSTLLDINSANPSNDVSKHITSAPSAAMDRRGHLWVFFGTGKYYGSDDKNQIDTGAFYAVKDACWNATCTTSYTSLLDISSATIKTDGTVTGINASCTSNNPVSTWSALSNAIAGCDGWVMNFSTLGETVDFTGETLLHDGERVISKPLVLGGLVTWTTYIPGTDVCSVGGDSNIYAVYYETGTAYKKYVFKEQKSNPPSNNVVARVKKLGKGMPSTVSAQITSSGTTKGFAQQSTGAILEIESITPFSLKSGIKGWKSEEIP